MNQGDVEHVVRTGEPRPFRPLAELLAEDQRMNRQQRRAAARAKRRKGRNHDHTT